VDCRVAATTVGVITLSMRSVVFRDPMIAVGGG
jgi:hypothetical protein